ncbi:MAG: hypothetical protein CMB89_13245 [Flammeovirgaceae bacterium]|nr:hypothetical protein [Flammeovirgaceae bacterium]|tara:strand:+ start:696 stop:2876 length:2181 start_codon:yes stop_codon:yes gene_type:complete
MFQQKPMIMTINNFIKKTTFMLLLLTVAFVGCNDEDDVEPMDPTGSLTVSDQALTENNSIIVSSVTLDMDGWIVVHASTSDGGPVVPGIISEAKMVSAGTSTNVEVMLNSDVEIADGDVVYVMLHTDDGTAGSYEFDGANGLDGPILDADGNIVMTSITLSVDSDPTGTLTVMDQTLSQNMVHIANVTMDRSGWIVVHASTGEGPVVPGIISEPKMVSAGSTDDVMVELTDFTDLSDGAMLYVMLHTDDGTAGEYEFDGANGFDNPIFDGSGNIVMTAITASAPTISVENQVVSENMVSIGDVNAAVDGWLVIHADNGEGAPGSVLGQTMVMAGSNSDVMVDLGTATFAGGEKLFPMLHIESPADGEYGFPDNGDGPEIFGEDVVVVGFETIAPSGAISVADQILQGNTLSVGSITLDATGWVVVHKSNATNDGPEVPGIISTPVQLEAGTTADVAVTLTEAVSADATLYVMLHTDNGEIGAYEFDGANGFDAPITTETFSVLSSSGSFTANDQVTSQDKIIVESITVGQPSWVVIHRDNGAGSFVAPGIISEPVALDAGTTADVEISLADGEGLTDGETLWIMIHNDNGTIGSYEFDGANGFDAPISFSSIDIMTPSVTASDQSVSASNTITVDEVVSGVDGWIVIHADNGSGSPGDVIGQTMVMAGTNTNVVVDLGDASVTSGAKLFPMLHIESPADGEYGFPDNGDGPEIFNGEVIVVSFTVQ